MPAALTISGEEFELHRVVAAAVLPGGGIAVADGGNHRVLVFDSNARLVRQFGRLGSGPAEFQMLSGLTTFGDTIVTYDAGLRRYVFWTRTGAVIRTMGQPTVGRTFVELRGIVSPTQLVLTSTITDFKRPSGLYHDSANVLRYDDKTRTQTSLGRYEWRFNAVLQHERGMTGYDTPFLGSTLIAAAAGRVLILPIGSDTVQIVRLDGSRGRGTALPLKPLGSMRPRLDSYREELLLRIQRSMPAPAEREARLSAEARVRDVFGSRFPLPSYGSRAQRAVPVGNEVWFQEFADPRAASVQWVIVDAVTERVVGAASLPIGWRVLGGDADRLIVHQADALGVEHVTVHLMRSRDRSDW